MTRREQETTIDTELRAEQAHVDRAYARLEQLVKENGDRLETILAEQIDDPIDPFTMPGPQFQAIYERDAMAFAAAARAKGLDFGDYQLCFGRIDHTNGTTYHLGRVAIPDADYEPLVVDWRAPVAEPFYRATGVEPMGLVRRRHFLCEGRTIVRLEDERFDSATEIGLSGPGALLEAIGRARTGKMRDIVATVQREQDEVIRAGLHGILVVDGGPGTGKTAVALHRAAYLLYTHRAKIGRVLVVGPNPVFLGYIDQVLPALGESGVDLSTVPGLLRRVEVRATEKPDAARVKGDVRMCEVVARAVRARERGLAQDRIVRHEDPGLGVIEIPLSAAQTKQIAERVRKLPGSHNDRRPVVEREVADVVYEGYASVVLAAAKKMKLKFPRGYSREDLVAERHDALPRLLGERDIVRVFDLMWPVLEPQDLVHDLYALPPLLRAATAGLLTDDERDAIAREWGEGPDTAPWTDDDLPIVEEAYRLLGPRQARLLPDPSDPPEELDVPVFGHIIVDEAQDLTPMQLRALARRSATGSMTLVGDLAQATGPNPAAAWEDCVAHLPRRGPRTVTRLSVSYRTPTEIMEYAHRVLGAGAGAAPTTVRAAEAPPDVRSVAPGDLAATAAEAAAAYAKHDGTVVLIGPPSMLRPLERALDEHALEWGHADWHGLTHKVTLGTPSVMKGLEFDSVVVVEPAAIVRESQQGTGALYVALTRATQRLAVLHSEELPEGLRDR